MGFIDHHQVPARQAQLLLEVFGAGQLIDAGDQQVMVVEGVSAARLFDLLSRKQRKRQAELLEHFVLPLLDQAAGGDDQHALGIRAHQQLADEEACHDGLASTGVVGQHVAQRLARQHRLVDRRDLVRQRLHVRRVHRHHRIEQVGQVDPVGLGGKFEVLAWGVEGPWAAGFGQRQVGLVGAEQHPLAQRAVGGLVVNGEGVVTDRLCRDDAYHLPGFQARDGRVLLDLFELQHAQPSLLVVS